MDIHEAMSALDDAIQEGARRQMNLPDWRYHDLPKLSVEYFDKFIAIAGKDNLRWITLAEYPGRNGGKLKRGQVMVSPEGVRRLGAYASELRTDSING